MQDMNEVWESASQQILAPEAYIQLICYTPDGREFTYSKNDLLRFSHRQTGDLVSGELPKNYIEFTLDNSDGRWDPGNPSGLEQYLSDRLRIVLRYGTVIRGDHTISEINWIDGGTFYLSEWRTSHNGVEASFVARDLLEFMLDKPYTGAISGNYRMVAQRAMREALGTIDHRQELMLDFPRRYFFAPVKVETDTDGGSDEGEGENTGGVGGGNIGGDELEWEDNGYRVSDEELPNDGSLSCAEIIQKLCNGAGAVMCVDRTGYLKVRKLDYNNTGYTIPLRISYSYPEFELARPLKGVEINYRDEQSLLYPYAAEGEIQTLDNDFIRTPEEATETAFWVCDSLRSRKKISGEFRGDPRFDLYDVVNVEGKYSTVTGVVLTDIEISFSGAFHVRYSGYVHGSGEPSVVYCGEIFTGEV